MYTTYWITVTWWRDQRVTCMLVGVFLFYYDPAKFEGLASCDSENKMFLICHVTTQSKYHVTLWVGSPHPKSVPCLVRDP